MSCALRSLGARCHATTTRGRGRRWTACRPDAIVNCAGLQRRRRRRGSSGRRAERSTRSPCGRWPARRTPSARRSCTTAPISSSTARRRRRTRKTDRAESAERLRGVEAARRVVRGSMRRAPTCCASRACSAARPAVRSRRAASPASSTRCIRAGDVAQVFDDRTVSPTYIIDAARATRQLLERDAPPGLYHCVNSGSCTWLEFAREAGAAARRRAAARSRCAWPTCSCAAARPQYCALSNAKLRRSASRCRRGRTRWEIRQVASR